MFVWICFSATGIIEPIPLEIKVDRGGLGQESEKKRKQEETIAMRAMMARKRHKHEAEWRDNLRAKLVDREVEKDLCQSQKVCEQLDSEQVSAYNMICLNCIVHVNNNLLFIHTLFDLEQFTKVQAMSSRTSPIRHDLIHTLSSAKSLLSVIVG